MIADQVIQIDSIPLHIYEDGGKEKWPKVRTTKPAPRKLRSPVGWIDYYPGLHRCLTPDY